MTQKSLSAFGIKSARKKYTPPKRLQKKVYSQSGGTKSRKADNRRTAKEPGWRKSAKGKWYFENRRNRSDTRYELEDKYKKMLSDADLIYVYYPGKWVAVHAFERFYKYNVRRWADQSTGYLKMPSEVINIMIDAKKAGGYSRIARKKTK